MDHTPLVKHEVDLGEQLIREFDAHTPVAAAFWLQPAESGTRHLYVVPEASDPAAFREAGVVLSRMAMRLRSPWFDPFAVRLWEADHAYSRAALEFIREYPQMLPWRLGGSYFGGVFLEDGYIYEPRRCAATPAISDAANSA